MSRLWTRFVGLLSSRTLMGVDKAGNRYFVRTEEIDGLVKEKRWVVFKGEQDPTSIPVEWICWLNGQRKKAPTQEEMAEMEARREQVKMNASLLKKEEEERKAAKAGKAGEGKVESTGKTGDPRFSGGNKNEGAGPEKDVERSSEPSGSGESFQPGSWQPPT